MGKMTLLDVLKANSVRFLENTMTNWNSIRPADLPILSTGQLSDSEPRGLTDGHRRPI